MNSAVMVRPFKPAVKRKKEVAELERTLGFPLVSIGQSNGPIYARPVGSEWWMEPLKPDTKLPARARQRLAAVKASGMKLKATVVFHEMPTARQFKLSRTKPAKFLRMGVRWLAQETPVVLDKAAVAARQHAPTIGRVLLALGIVSLTVLAVVAKASAAVATTVVTVALADPCLVVIDEQGHFYEIDRWF